MEFQRTKDYLIEVFNRNGFVFLFRKGKQKKVVLETLSNGSVISIVFPGYKSKITKSKTIYDYRVDLEKNRINTTLSHSNIIVDIYNKLINTNIDSDKFLQYVILSSEDCPFDLSEVKQELKYNPVNPNRKLLNKVKTIYRGLGKSFNPDGNLYDLTLEELFISLKWIVLQEDINYPIKKGFEGRKMCYSRYVETIHLEKIKSKTLKEVIERTLSHYRPSKWKEINYDFLKKVK